MRILELDGSMQQLRVEPRPAPPRRGLTSKMSKRPQGLAPLAQGNTSQTGEQFKMRYIDLETDLPNLKPVQLEQVWD